MIHPHTELRFVNPRVGLGVVATKRIPKGTVVWVLDPLDQVLSPDRCAALDPQLRTQLDRYSHTDARGNLVLCWDHGRFVNHSCEATCLGPDGSNFKIAVRDIEAGEQLTDDYRALGLAAEDAFDCVCGAPSCVGRVAPAPPAVRRRWDAAVGAALASFSKVPQPLASWLAAHELAEVLEEEAPDEHDGYSEVVPRPAVL